MAAAYKHFQDYLNEYYTRFMETKVSDLNTLHACIGTTVKVGLYKPHTIMHTVPVDDYILNNISLYLDPVVNANLLSAIHSRYQIPGKDLTLLNYL